MKKIVGTAISMSDDCVYTEFIRVGDDDSDDDAVSSTLCRAVGDLPGPEPDDVPGMREAARSGDSRRALSIAPISSRTAPRFGCGRRMPRPGTSSSTIRAHAVQASSP